MIQNDLLHYDGGRESCLRKITSFASAGKTQSVLCPHGQRANQRAPAIRAFQPRRDGVKRPLNNSLANAVPKPAEVGPSALKSRIWLDGSDASEPVPGCQGTRHARLGPAPGCSRARLSRETPPRRASLVPQLLRPRRLARAAAA